MPTLKQLTCHVERGPIDSPLHEYATEYSDGVVTSYLEVPNKPTAFKIHLTSHGFIAHGLAMFVFIDGKPQCNRNRRDLVVSCLDSERDRTEVDFRVHRKEVRTADGKWLARPWRFEKLNIVEADSVPEVSEHVKWNTGTIEVIVLRCENESVKIPSSNLPRRRKSITKKAAPSIPNSAAIPERRSTFQPLSKAKRNSVKFDLKPDAKEVASSGAQETKAPAPVPPPRPTRRRYRLPHINLWGPLFDGAADVPPDARSKFLPQSRRRQETVETRNDAKIDDDEPFTFAMFDQLDGTSDSSPAGIVINQYNAPDDDQNGEQTFRRRRTAHTSSLPPEAHWHTPYPMPTQAPIYPPPFAYPPVHAYGYSPMTLPPGSHVPPYSSGPVYGNGYPIAHQHAHFPHPIEQASRQASGQSGSSSNKKPGWDNQHTTQGSPQGTNANARQENNPGNNGFSSSPANGSWDNNGNDNNLNGDQWNTTNYVDDGNDNNNDNSNGQHAWDNNNTSPQVQGDWASPANDTAQQTNNEWNQITNETLGAWSNPTFDANAYDTANTRRSRTSRTSNNDGPANTANTIAYPPIDPKRPHIKAYWSQFQPRNAADSTYGSRDERRAAALERANSRSERPTAPIPAAAASQAQLSHALQPGAGATYVHPTRQPKYIDSMDKPYAVFCFKYRSADRLKVILGEDLAAKEHKIERGKYKEKMLALSKEEVVEELMRAKKALHFDTDSSMDEDLGFEDSNSEKEQAEPRPASVKSGEAKTSWDAGNQDKTQW